MNKRKALVWDEWNKNHIKKHNVSVIEVKQAYQSGVIEIKSYLNRKIILGKTKKERLLTIVVSFEKQQKPYIVSARNMSNKERRLYYENKKK